MKYYLVLGSEGQLGQSLVKVKPEDVTLIPTPKLDIRNFEGLRDALCSQWPNLDGVINCAAYTNVDLAESDIQTALDINAYALVNIATLCRSWDIPLIHISTDYVFDGTTPEYESVSCNPLNNYGYSKMIGEEVVRGLYKDATIIRTASVYSEFGKNFLKSLLSRYHDGQREFDVVCDQMSCPTYAPDLAATIFAVLSFGVRGRTLHYAGEEYISWDSFARMIFNSVDPTVKVNPVLASTYNAKALRPEHSKLITTTMLTPSNPMRGVAETLSVLLNKERE